MNVALRTSPDAFTTTIAAKNYAHMRFLLSSTKLARKIWIPDIMVTDCCARPLCWAIMANFKRVRRNHMTEQCWNKEISFTWSWLTGSLWND